MNLLQTEFWIFFWPSIVALLASASMLSVQGVYTYAARTTLSWIVIAQATMTGMTLGWILEMPEFANWLLAIATGHTVLQLLESRTKAKESSLLSSYFGLQALSVVLLHTHAHESHDLAAVLFGSAVFVSESQAILLSILALSILGVGFALRKALLLSVLQPKFAQSVFQWAPTAQRLRKLTSIASVAFVVQVIGLAPAMAYAVLLPHAAANTRSFGAMWAFALVSAIVVALGGFISSILLDWPLGSTQVLMCALVWSASGWLLKQK